MKVNESSIDDKGISGSVWSRSQRSTKRDNSEPVLPCRSVLESDAAWGDRDPSTRDEEYLADKPPHWS